jgi:hypothetical protein
VLHEKHKVASITGCVSTRAEGLILVADKDQREYGLSGNTSAVKPGDRITVEGRLEAAHVFAVRDLTKDLGVCQQ